MLNKNRQKKYIDANQRHCWLILKVGTLSSFSVRLLVTRYLSQSMTRAARHMTDRPIRSTGRQVDRRCSVWVGLKQDVCFPHGKEPRWRWRRKVRLQVSTRFDKSDLIPVKPITSEYKCLNSHAVFCLHLSQFHLIHSVQPSATFRFPNRSIIDGKTSEKTQRLWRKGWTKRETS